MMEKVSWYAKLFHSKRYAQARELVMDLKQAALWGITNLKLSGGDFPEHLENQAFLALVFQSLAEQQYEDLKKEFLNKISLQLRSVKRSRMKQARQILEEFRPLSDNELRLCNFDPDNLPNHLLNDQWILDEALRGLATKTSEEVKKEILEKIKEEFETQRAERLGWLAEHLRLKLKRTLSSQTMENTPHLESLKNIVEQDLLINLLSNCLKSELLKLENALYDDEMILVLTGIIESKEQGAKAFANMQREKEERRREKEAERYHQLMRDRNGGRESTSKGSIGHDILNVKTLSPSEWKARAAMVLRPGTTPSAAIKGEVPDAPEMSKAAPQAY